MKSSIEYGNKIEKTAQSVGIAADALQELHYAGQLVDLSAEQMSQSIGLFSRKMKEAKDGSEQAAKAFSGIKFLEGGKLRATDEVLASVADKFQKMPDGAEKTGLAMQLFGRAGKQMIPFLNKGAEGLAEMRQEARDLGLVMGEDAIKASVELDENMKRLSAVTQGLWRQAVPPLLPAISALVKRFLEWKKANGAILAQKIKGFLSGVIWAVNRLADVMEFLIKNSEIVIGVLGVMVLSLAAVKAAAIGAAIASAAAWAAAAAPFVAIGAAIAAILLLWEDFKVFKQGGHSVIGDLKKGLDEWLEPKVGDPWFVKAIKKFATAIKNAINDIDIFKGKITDVFKLLPPVLLVRILGAGGEAAADLAAHAVNQLSNVDAQLYQGGVIPHQQPVPELPPGGGVTKQETSVVNHFNVTQLPGESGSDFSARVVDIFDEHIGTIFEKSAPPQ